jgi:hypothetical protein
MANQSEMLLNKRDAPQTETVQPVQTELAPEIPDRPALAPNVQLIGEMQGTGFVDRQWLVMRNDQFVQVT